MSRALLLTLAPLFALFAGACSEQTPVPEPAPEGLLGTVQVDGSSTVFPITEELASRFGSEHEDVVVTVAISGTGGGFRRFGLGETDINNASRRISDDERSQLANRGIEYFELTVAHDGLSVVVHPGNDFVDYLTTAELRRIWEQGSDVRRWSDVRPGWPTTEIALFSPGRDSGTFDYFAERINGASGAYRDDVTTSEDDVVLVEGIADEPQALSFFGYAYYRTNRERLRVVPIDAGAGPVTPTPASVADGSYRPLSRPLYIYVNRESLQRPEVHVFVRYYFRHIAEVVEQVGYIPLSADDYRATLDRLTRSG